MAEEREQASRRRAELLQRVKIFGPMIAGACVGVVFRLLYSGGPQNVYNAMTGSFVVIVPIVIAAVAVYLSELTERRSWSYYFKIGAATNVLFVLVTFMVLIEGLICVILAAPLFAFIGGIGGLVAGALFRVIRRPRETMYGLAVLPFLVGIVEPLRSLPNEIESVSRSVMIEAPAERVWEQLLTTRDISPGEMDSAWMYRIGVPPPLSTYAEEQDGELVRHVVMGRAIRFDQVSTDWEPNRRVRWTYRFTEDSFPPGALDDHVTIGGKYFDLIDTEYTLSAVPGGSELRVEMRYRVSTRFNWYAKPVARLLIGNFETTALHFYARRARSTVLIVRTR